MCVGNQKHLNRLLCRIVLSCIDTKDIWHRAQSRSRRRTNATKARRSRSALLRCVEAAGGRRERARAEKMSSSMLFVISHNCRIYISNNNNNNNVSRNREVTFTNIDVRMCSIMSGRCARQSAAIHSDCVIRAHNQL